MSRFVLIGHPVAHSVSPAIHRAAYRELGHDHSYELLDAPDERAVRAVVERIASGEIAGANVTVPHKRLALALATTRDPVAERIGAANVLGRDGSSVCAYNTDAMALAAALGGPEVPRTRALVVGNGGAALAAVVACQMLGVERPRVVARAFKASESPRTWPRASEFTRLGTELLPWPEPGGDFAELAQDPELLIQATSAGMSGFGGGEELARLFSWETMAATTQVYDLVYNPRVTPFVAAARAAGLNAEGGLSMLVGQAVEAIWIWLAERPPHAPLQQAAEQALGHS